MITGRMMNVIPMRLVRRGLIVVRINEIGETMFDVVDGMHVLSKQASPSGKRSGIVYFIIF